MKPKKTALMLGAALISLLFCVSCAPTEPLPPAEDLSAYAVSFVQSSADLLVGHETLGTLSLAPAVTKDEAILPGASLTYVSQSPAVASVDEGGVVTAQAAGTAEITATYTAPSGKSASGSMTVRVFADATAEDVNSFEEEFVNLYGRMDNDKAGEVHIDNVGSGLEVAFYGTQLKAKLAVTATLYGHVFLDGVMQEFVRFSSGEVTLAANLKEGIHTVGVYKSSEINEGRLTIQALYADRFLQIPEKSDLKIEFIGDSITCGYGDLLPGGPDVTRSIENSDACVGYAFLTGRALGADFSLISYSGICVKKFMWGGTLNMEELHTYTSLQTKKLHTYDAAMDAVVLNLGTNDASYINTVDTAYGIRRFSEDYKQFVAHLREIYPQAHIVCIYGMMGRDNMVHSGIQKAVDELNDPKITYQTFPQSTSGVNGHPYLTAHALYAETLTAYLAELLAR